MLVSQFSQTIPLIKGMYEKSLERHGRALAQGLANGSLCDTLIELSDWQFLYFRKKEYDSAISEGDRAELKEPSLPEKPRKLGGKNR